MLKFTLSLCLVLVTVSADTNSFHKGTSTDKPRVPFEDSPVPKPRKPPTHISEFTDPDTGLNPFLDLEEGPTSAGRNVMKDERRDDLPFLDFEMVEGDTSGRRWGSEIPKEQPRVEEPTPKWSPAETEENTNKRQPTTTTIQYTSDTPTTSIDSYREIFSDEESPEKGDEEQKIKKEVRTSEISPVSIMYVSTTVVVVVILALLVGVCWWRQKLKRTSRLPVVVENGEMKS